MDNDPYILGKPMGWLGSTIFILIMVVLPIVMIVSIVREHNANMLVSRAHTSK